LNPSKRALSMAQAARKHDILLHVLVVCTFVVIMWAFHSIVFELVNPGAAQRKYTRESLLNH
jgi:t-SNARE complex subunit (syntaxin)